MSAILNKLLKFFTSLRLTVVCLAFALGLVFIGTLAQVKMGLYIVQENYFQSFFVRWQPENSDWSIPIYPGGYLLGTLLLVNLIAAHIQRFEMKRKKIGIFTIHAGLILLLVGQLFTELFQVESFMRIPEGESRNYSESHRESELAVVDTTDEKSDRVVAIPARLLRTGGEITHEALPFKLVVKRFNGNSLPELSEASEDSGRFRKLLYKEQPRAVKMNDRDIPVAEIEVVAKDGTKLGEFTLSNWISELHLSGLVREKLGSFLPPDFDQPPVVSHAGRQYALTLRSARYYKPYEIKMLDFQHDKYIGTDIPKNFSSRVQLIREETREDREVLIYMNNPLRYGGETYYQGSFERGDVVSILQVVRNPSWLTPYLACALVGIGLLTQFLQHLIGFARKRAA